MAEAIRDNAGEVEGEAKPRVTQPLITPKVFGIGFHKTGTTSLGDALALLGYRVTGPNGIHVEGMDRAGAWRLASGLLPDFDAFQDNPWPPLFRELDRELPGSKFVLTVRPEPDWLRSVIRDFGQKTTPMREWIYGVGTPLGNEEIFLERYRRHNLEVIEYFDGRNDDLLVMAITEGDGWGSLCPFLGRPLPDAPFPRSNPAVDPSLGRRSLTRFRRRVSQIAQRGG